MIKSLAVINHDDPQIVSYGILEDRNRMTELLNAADYNLDFQVSFVDSNYLTVPLDSRIGFLEFGLFADSKKLEHKRYQTLEHAEMTESPDKNSYNNVYYKPKDFSLIEFRGA